MLKEEWEKIEVGDLVFNYNYYKVINKTTSPRSYSSSTGEPILRYELQGLLVMYGKSLRPVRNNSTVTTFEWGHKVTRDELVGVLAIANRRLSTAQQSVEVIQDMLQELEK